MRQGAPSNAGQRQLLEYHTSWTPNLVEGFGFATPLVFGLNARSGDANQAIRRFAPRERWQSRHQPLKPRPKPPNYPCLMSEHCAETSLPLRGHYSLTCSTIPLSDYRQGLQNTSIHACHPEKEARGKGMSLDVAPVY